jgi:hypothetical protein
MHVFKGEGQQPATPCLHGSDRMGNWERTLRSGNTRGDSTLSPLASGGTRCYRRHGRAPCCRIRICTRDTTHWCIHTCTRCNALIMVVPVTIVVQSGGHDGPEGGRIHPSLSVRKAAWTPAVKTDWLAPVGVAPVVTPRDAYTQPPAPSTTPPRPTTPRRPIAPHGTPTPLTPVRITCRASANMSKWTIVRQAQANALGRSESLNLSGNWLECNTGRRVDRAVKRSQQ